MCVECYSAGQSKILSHAPLPPPTTMCLHAHPLRSFAPTCPAFRRCPAVIAAATSAIHTAELLLKRWLPVLPTVRQVAGRSSCHAAPSARSNTGASAEQLIHESQQRESRTQWHPGFHHPGRCCQLLYVLCPMSQRQGGLFSPSRSTAIIHAHACASLQTAPSHTLRSCMRPPLTTHIQLRSSGPWKC